MTGRKTLSENLENNSIESSHKMITICSSQKRIISIENCTEHTSTDGSKDGITNRSK